MTTTIDQLQIEIQSSSAEASSGIDALRASLEKLKTAVSGTAGLRSVNKQLVSLNSTLQSISSGNAAKLQNLSNALKILADCGKIKLSSTLAPQITAIGSAAQSLQGTNMDAVGRLSSSLAPLSNMRKANLNSFISQLNRLPEAMNALNSVDMTQASGKVQQLVSVLSPLSAMGKNNLSSFNTQLKKLPETFQTLNSIDMNAFAAKIQSVANAMKPLATQMQQVANGFSSFPTRIQKLISSTDKLSASNSKLSSSANITSSAYVKFAAKLGTVVVAVRKAANVIAGWITKSNKYIEDLNLFNASMGQYADQSQSYGETVSEVMGIDPSQWMRNQGVFMTLATGFGVAGDRAYTMSKNLTQLGYDLSSFFNLPFKESFEKLQSGISGELEPLRRLGFDLSVARLQQEALTLGIEKSVNAMTQAEKAELRYYAIMTQVTTAQGDMARTLNAPSNQLRILQSQVTQVARALGNIFIPALNAVLPYAIALAKGLRVLAEAVAGLFGFELPEVDYSSLQTGAGVAGDLASSAEDAGSGLSGAADSAKELKNALLGIDELNVISQDTSAASGAAGGSGVSAGGGSLGFELPEYDFLSDAVSSQIDKISKKLEPLITFAKDNFTEIATTVAAIGAGLLAWKISSKLLSDIPDVSGVLTNLKDWFKNNKVAIGISMMVSGVTLSVSGSYSIGYKGATWTNVLQTIIGDALIVGGSLLTFGTGPAGWLIGIGVALTATVVGFSLGYDKKLYEDAVKERFGTIDLTDSQIQSIIKMNVAPELSVQLDAYIDQKDATDAIFEDIQELQATLAGYNVVLELGGSVTFEEYESAVDEYLASVQNYIGSRQLESQIAIGVVFGDSESGSDFSELTSSYYTSVSGELAALGTEMKQHIAAAFESEEFDIDEFKQAQQIQKEIQLIMQEIEQAEFSAQLQAIGLNFIGTTISKESFDQLLSDIQTTVDERLAQIDELQTTLIADANLQLQEGSISQSEYDQIISQIQTQVSGKKAEIIVDGLNVSLAPLQEAYSAEFEVLEGLMSGDLETVYQNVFGTSPPETSYYNAAEYILSFSDAYTEAFRQLDSGTQQLIQEHVNSLQPTKEQLETIAAQYKALGLEVPESVNEGLTDIAKLEALTGSADGISYLLSQKLSTDPTFQDLLTTAGQAGGDIVSALTGSLAGSSSVLYDAGAGTVTMCINGIQVQLDELTPDMIEQMENSGLAIAEGLATGVEDGTDDNKNWFEKTWDKIKDWFDGLFDINSPSKWFETRGKYLVDGLHSGISGKWSTISEFFTSSVGTISSLFTTAWSSISESASSWWGYIKDTTIGTKWEELKTKASDTWNNIKSTIFNGWKGADEYTSTWLGYSNDTTIGTKWEELKTKASDTWNNLKSTIYDGWEDADDDSEDWWGTIKKTITDVWGDIEDDAEDLGENVLSNFKGSASYNNFYTVASDVVRGFKNGIGDLYSTCKTTITTWGGSIISWFKQKLNSNSPSKVFEQIGFDTVEGYNIGLQDMGKTTKGVVNNWADSFTDITPTMALAVDTSALKHYDTSSLARTVETQVESTYKVSADGFEKNMELFYRQYIEPVLTQIAEDMRRQADKEEQTIVKIGAKTVAAAVTAQQKANGYVFAK